MPLMTTLDYRFEFKYLQFPIKLCSAMTINKAKGQYLRKVGTDLRGTSYSHGHNMRFAQKDSSAKGFHILPLTENII